MRPDMMATEMAGREQHTYCPHDITTGSSCHCSGAALLQPVLNSSIQHWAMEIVLKGAGVQCCQATAHLHKRQTYIVVIANTQDCTSVWNAIVDSCDRKHTRLLPVCFEQQHFSLKVLQCSHCTLVQKGKLTLLCNLNACCLHKLASDRG